MKALCIDFICPAKTKPITLLECWALVAWLAVLAQVVDWAYRHLFRSLLSHSLVGGVLAILLAVAVPPMLNMLNSVLLTRE